MRSMSQPLLSVSAFTVLLIVTACSSNHYYTNREAGYQNAKLTAPLELPADHDQSEFHDIMPVPQVNQDFIKSTQGFVVPAPSFLMAPSQQAVLDIQQTKGQSWLLVQNTPEILWPLLQDYVNEKKLTAVKFQPDQGTIISKEFTLAMRRSQNGQATELYCLHHDQADNRCIEQLKQFLLTRLNQAIPLSDDQQRQQMQQVRLVAANNQWQLVVNKPLGILWQTLVNQLNLHWQQDDQKLLQKDEKQHQIKIRFKAQAAQGTGWLSIFSGAKVADYQLKLKALNDQQTIITVAAVDDKTVDEAVAREILTRLAGFLN